MGEEYKNVVYLLNQMNTDQERINFLEDYLADETNNLSQEDKNGLEELLNEYKERSIPPKPQKENKLPVRSFWEIYNDTKTEHCGTIGRMMYQMAHMPILPNEKEDTMHKLLSLVTIPAKLVMKPFAYVGNKIANTDDKMNTFRENINNLSPEEFAVLTKSPQEVNQIFQRDIKASYDNDYLNPNFMKQHKSNNLYLDAVRERMTAETNQTVELVNNALVEINQNIENLINTENRTPEQENALNNYMQLKTVAENQARQSVDELKTFENGAKEKSSMFRNISGWFLGKFNPDTREADEKMAELSKQRRETAEQGEISEIAKNTNEMNKFEKEQTNIKKILWNPNNKIDIGTYSIESPVELLDKGPQTKGKLLFANIAMGTAIMNFVEHFKNQARVDNAINEHNQDIANTNAQNQNLNTENANNNINSDLINRAKEDVINTKTAAAHAGGEYANLDKNGIDIGWSEATKTQAYKDADDLLHATTTKVDTSHSLKDATDFFENVKKSAIPIHEKYATAHGEFDYSGYINALENTDSSAIVELFNKLGNGNIQSTVDAAMQSNMTGIDLNNLSGIFMAALAGAKLAETIQKENELNKNINKEIAKRSQIREEDNQQEENNQPEIDN